MNYPVNLPGFEGQNIEAQIGFWTGPKLLVNGEVAPKGEKRGQMLLQRNDGKQVVATWKPQVIGLDVPQLMIEGESHQLVEPLKWYQLVWGGWPIVLVFAGGMLGAFFGFIGFALNTKVFRSEMNDALKYIATAAVSALAVVAYFVLAIFVSLLIN